MTRVMLVEDDAALREEFARSLRAAGHSVIVSHDAYAALFMVQQLDQPDVFVVDVGLPSMDGFSFVQLARTDATIPVVYLNAGGIMPSKRLAHHEVCLAKPLNASRVVEQVGLLIADREKVPAPAGA